MLLLIQLLSRVWLFCNPFAQQPTKLLCPRNSPGKNTGVVANSSPRRSSPPKDRIPVPVSPALDADSLSLSHMGSCIIWYTCTYIFFQKLSCVQHDPEDLGNNCGWHGQGLCPQKSPHFNEGNKQINIWIKTKEKFKNSKGQEIRLRHEMLIQNICKDKDYSFQKWCEKHTKLLNTGFMTQEVQSQL